MTELRIPEGLYPDNIGELTSSDVQPTEIQPDKGREWRQGLVSKATDALVARMVAAGMIASGEEAPPAPGCAAFTHPALLYPEDFGPSIIDKEHEAHHAPAGIGLPISFGETEPRVSGLTATPSYVLEQQRIGRTIRQEPKIVFIDFAQPAKTMPLAMTVDEAIAAGLLSMERLAAEQPQQEGENK